MIVRNTFHSLSCTICKYFLRTHILVYLHLVSYCFISSMKINFPFAVDCKDRESSQCSLCAKLEQSLCIDVRHSPVNDQNVSMLGCCEYLAFLNCFVRSIFAYCFALTCSCKTFLSCLVLVRT